MSDGSMVSPAERWWEVQARREARTVEEAVRTLAAPGSAQTLRFVDPRNLQVRVRLGKPPGLEALGGR